MGSSAGQAAGGGLVPRYHGSHSNPATSEEPTSQLVPPACAFQDCCAASGGCIDCISSTYSGSSHLHEPSQAQPPLGPFLDHMYAAVAWCNLHHNHILCRTTMRCRQYVLNLHAIKLQGHNLWAWLMLAWVCRQLYAIYTSAPALQGTTSGPASEAAALQAAQELCDEEEVDKAHAAAKQAKKQRQKLKKKQASTASQQEAVPFDILQSASDSQHSPRIPAAVSTDRPQRTASPVPDVTPVLDAGTPCQQDSARPYQSPPGPARSGPSDPGNHLPQDCLPSAYQTSTPSQAAPNKDDRRDDHADDISYDAAHSSTAQLQCMTGNNLTAAEGVFCPGQPSDNMCSAGAIHRLIALHPHLCCPLTQVSQGLVFAVCIVHKQACSLIASALYEFLEIELYCPVATIVGQS